MRTLESTAMAIESATPARPGSVKFASTSTMQKKTASAFTSSDTLAMMPGTK